MINEGEIWWFGTGIWNELSHCFTGIKTLLNVIFISTFSLISPIGAGIGIAVSETVSSEADVQTSAVTVLQGLATGTLLYVVFFEVIEKERLKKTNGLMMVRIHLRLSFSLSPSFFRRRQNTQGWKNLKLKEKAQNPSTKLKVSANLVRIAAENKVIIFRNEGPIDWNGKYMTKYPIDWWKRYILKQIPHRCRFMGYQMKA